MDNGNFAERNAQSGVEARRIRLGTTFGGAVALALALATSVASGPTLASGTLTEPEPVETSTIRAEPLETGFHPALGGWRLDVRLRLRLRMLGVRPLRDRDFANPSSELVELGRSLFYDKELSGDRDVACSTCHHPLAATSDGLSLPAGVGGTGLSSARAMGADRSRVPRNSPELFNRGHASFTVMFWDGRVAEDGQGPGGFRNPAGSELPTGVLETALDVQAMFPVTSREEMRGKDGDNELANAATNTEIWQRLMDRLLAFPEYGELFARAYPGVPPQALGFDHAARALGAFQAVEWRADDSPFDRYLRGNRDAMTQAAKRGALLFYGEAACHTCHAGPLQTDLEFHAAAAPQLGPGKGDGVDGLEDFGREQATGIVADRYKFRTPSLRNVALTGPWGHAGGLGTLRAAVEHQLDPVEGLESWDRTQVLLPPMPEGTEDDPFVVHDDDGRRQSIADACELVPRRLRPHEIDDLVEFLHALTDPRSLDLRADVPRRVPSGLPQAD